MNIKKSVLFITAAAIIIISCFGLAACKKRDAEIAVSAVIVDGSVKDTFDVDESFCYDTAKLSVTFKDGSVKEIPVDSSMLTEFDTSTTGLKTLTVAYGGITVNAEYEVVYLNYPSREIVTKARLKVNQSAYPTGIGREIVLSQGKDCGFRAVYFTVKGSGYLCDKSLNTLDISTDFNVTATSYFVDAKTIKIIIASKNGFADGTVAVINFAGVTNAEVSLTEIVVSDGKKDYYLPDAKGV